MQLTYSQNKKVKELFDAFLNKETSKSVAFKAPTGAGKTLMASEFISRVFANEYGKENKKTIFVVATISSARLPKEMAKKLNRYKKYHEFNDYSIEYIQSPSSKKSSKYEGVPEFVLEDNKVFVFGLSSFGKSTLFHLNKTLDTFLESVENEGYQVFFVRDEAHISGKKEAGKNELMNFDQKMKKCASFVLEMTATINNHTNLIRMTEEDMRNDNCYLLKSEMVKTKLKGEVTNEEIIDDAIRVFKEVKNEYASLNVDPIFPAMLVQISNNSKVDNKKNLEFTEGLKLLERKLKNASLKYLKYIDSPEIIGSSLPATLEFASKNDTPIDVIIFKVGPATGWDIPRANMLLQLRNVSSETLNVQTLGRIMRNPYPNLQKNDITDKYYFWSNYQKPTRQEAFYKLKKEFTNKDFFAGKIDENNRVVTKDFEEYRNQVLSFIDDPLSGFKNKVESILSVDIIYDILDYGSAYVVNKIPNHIYLKIYNIRKARELENSLNVSLFMDKLRTVSEELDKNYEIVKYVFFSFRDELIRIKSKNSTWVKNEDPYKLIENAKTRETYSIWVDNVKDKNKEPKHVNTKKLKNYGYLQLFKDKDTQYLDSEPEEKFFENFCKNLVKSEVDKIKFFAKMPTLGSQIYFEYYSHINGKITKSFMDFAIEYKDKIIMVEVKSEDREYSKSKTDELLEAYEIYMTKFKNKNLHLIVYQYNKKNENHRLHMMMNGKWEDNVSFKAAIDYLLDR